MNFKTILLLAFFLIGKTIVSSQNAIQLQPKYTPKKLVENYLDTIKFKDIKPTKNGLVDGEITDYILTQTGYFDVDDSKKNPIRGGGNLVICFKGRMEKGKKQGKFKSYFIEDKYPYNMILNMEQEYKDDKRHGEWKTYDLSGNLIVKQYFKGDSLDGADIRYWFNGNKASESHYENGQLNGKYIEYSFKGLRVKEVNYKKGKLHELGKQFYESGKLMEEQQFKDGKLSGFRKYYYENGQLWIELIFNDSKPWKVVSNFDNKGNKRDAGTLNNGNGTIIYYDEDGTIREVTKYKDGVEVK